MIAELKCQHCPTRLRSYSPDFSDSNLIDVMAEHLRIEHKMPDSGAISTAGYWFRQEVIRLQNIEKFNRGMPDPRPSAGVLMVVGNKNKMICVSCGVCGNDELFTESASYETVVEMMTEHLIVAHRYTRTKAKMWTERFVTRDILSTARFSAEIAGIELQPVSRFNAKVLGQFEEEITINKESISMNTKTVQVRFDDSSKIYNFFTDIEDLVEGEKIVVRAATGLAIVTVLSTPKLSTIGRDKANAWVISKIDFSGEEKRIKKAKLEEELKKAIEATSVIERAKQLAALNPELAALIAQLEELG